MTPGADGFGAACGAAGAGVAGELVEATRAAGGALTSGAGDATVPGARRRRAEPLAAASKRLAALMPGLRRER